MKKFISMLLVSSVLITSLTACNNEKTSSGSSDSTGSSSSTVEDSAPASDNSDSTTPENDSSTPEDSGSTPEDSSGPDESSDEDEGVDNSGLPYPDTKAGSLTKAALATDVWPGMDLPEDPDFITALFSADFNLEDYEEFCFATNIISAQLNKVIIIKPKAGSEDAASAAVDAYFEAVKNDPNIAFYPGQQASADGAVKGQTDDGYLYIIVHENGAAIESAMLAAV